MLIDSPPIPSQTFSSKVFCLINMNDILQYPLLLCYQCLSQSVYKYSVTLSPCPSVTVAMAESKAHLRIIQITDVYTLVNFPKLKTLIKEKAAEVEATGGKCISMLTGDFLAPYLLSSLDKVESQLSSSQPD